MSKQYFIQGANPGEKTESQRHWNTVIEGRPRRSVHRLPCERAFPSGHETKPEYQFKKVSREVMDAVPQRLKAVNIEYWILFESLANVTYAEYKFGRSSSYEDRSLFNFEAGQKCPQSQTRADSARPFEVEEEDDDDEIPLDSSCKTGLQLW